VSGSLATASRRATVRCAVSSVIRRSEAAGSPRPPRRSPSQDGQGYGAGARDPVVGAALALLHRSTSHPWTLTELASKAGTSRSVLAERFARYLGEPPLAYLARWRLQLAARKLQTTEDAIMQVAWEVRVRSGVQSRVQAGVRSSARPVPQETHQRGRSRGRAAILSSLICVVHSVWMILSWWPSCRNTQLRGSAQPASAASCQPRHSARYPRPGWHSKSAVLAHMPKMAGNSAFEASL
jgi:AraC-like DNA-binding protein